MAHAYSSSWATALTERRIGWRRRGVHRLVHRSLISTATAFVSDSHSVSYDYSLFRALGEGPMDMWPAASPGPIGTVDEVKARLGAIFPEASWRLSQDTWFGASTQGAETAVGFQLTPDADGQCRWLTVRRVTVSEVQDLCRALGLVAVDAQKVALIRP